ncbi:MAG: hypothetical protein GY866_14255 [Proteobacteria bacterium]|nr:hypothetical protein [Pseudomonadota bacterium]
MLKKTLITIVAVFNLTLGICIPDLPAAPSEDVLQPLPVMVRDKIQLIEGIPYCYAGYGNQQTVFNIQGRDMFSEAVSNPYLPPFEPLLTTFLKAGCVMDKIFVDFYLIDDAVKFADTIQSDGKSYNGITFQYDVLSVGYSFTLVPHFLYLDMGIGYFQINYNLGFYGGSSDNASETFNHDDWLLDVALKYVFSHYVFLHWQHQKAVRKESVLDYTNQLGINFLVRF